jgi:hypothetical protein
VIAADIDNAVGLALAIIAAIFLVIVLVFPERF